MSTSNKEAMVGLPLDDSSRQSDGSIATKAAEAELQRRVESLQDQLQNAMEALERLRNSGESSSQAAGFKVARPLDSKSVAPPPGKRGYLFKWLDRSIGWGGTKWALRFVTLEHGRIAYYGTHTDTSPRYVLNLRGCAVRDDGWKRNRRHPSKKGVEPPLDETGAYFFLFSIYQRPSSANDDIDEQDDSEIVPLLRFSTPSLAEKTQWVQLIAEACAYCETEDFLADEAVRAAERALQEQQQRRMTMTMPEAKEGTLPALYFAPAVKKHARRPSFSKVPSADKFRTKSREVDAEKVDARSTRGYPASKPMHRAAAPSYLSEEASVQNYRGFFNLGIIILVVSNFRLILGTIRRHGFVLTRAVEHVKDLRHISRDPWEEFPFVSGFLLQIAFVMFAFGIEWLLSRKRLSESFGMILHHINAHASLVIPMAIVWHFIDKPMTGAILLLHATMTWMKLLSYVLANEDYRLSSKKSEDSHKATLVLIENLDTEDIDIVYPENVTVRNMIYFWLAPTLTYQIAFPKYPRVRVLKIVGYLVRMAICLTLFTFLVVQVVTPNLEALVSDLEASHGTYTAGMLAEYWLRLSIANTYLWLLMFYFYFHLYLNLFAEMLRFGDRVFYKDWWNSSEVSAYWRLWNMPVHYWLVRHVYFPCIRLKMSKIAATLVVFLISAIMHEALVSIPFHMVRPWSFIGMMMQVPLVVITKYLWKRFPGSSIGNMIFWVSFCVVGQPMAILLYTVDYQYLKQHHPAMECEILEEECRVMWNDRCLIR